MLRFFHLKNNLISRIPLSRTRFWIFLKVFWGSWSSVELISDRLHWCLFWMNIKLVLIPSQRKPTCIEIILSVVINCPKYTMLGDRVVQIIKSKLTYTNIQNIQCDANLLKEKVFGFNGTTICNKFVNIAYSDIEVCHIFSTTSAKLTLAPKITEEAKEKNLRANDYLNIQHKYII